MKRIVVLISGRGSNMEALVRRRMAESWPAQIVAVLSNRPDAAGLAFARAHGIETAVVDHRTHATREAFDLALHDAVARHAPDLVVLAGFMRVLGRAWSGRLLNIHPSLLPSFPGLHTHQRALEAGCKVAGATVHFVTEALDHGPIVIQSAVPVHPDDTEDTLAARVLATEHQIYPRAVRWFVDGALEVAGGRVRQRDGQAQWLIAPDTPRLAP
jgi:phosphoribosylglycinamide formyltransferase-1